MDNDAPNLESEPTDEAWRQIEELVEEIARLSRSEVSAAEFYKELLDRVVSTLAAQGGIVWARGAGGKLERRYQIDPAEGGLSEDCDGWQRHHRLLAEVSATGQCRLVPPLSGPAGGDRAGNPTPFLLVLCPWRVAEEKVDAEKVDAAEESDELAGVIEVFQRPGASPQTQRGYLQFLSAIGELVADFHRNHQVRTFQARVAGWRRFEQYVARVHGSLDLRETAYQIANEGRRLIDCDRVSVLSSKCRLLAVSGVDTPNRRANVAGQLERLAAAVVAYDEPLWHGGRPEDLPPEIQQSLNAYLDESHVRRLAVIPLRLPDVETGGKRSRPLGVLVVEQFQGDFDEGLRGRVDAACRHAALALHCADELRSIPLVRPMQMLGRATWFVREGRLPKTIGAVLAVAAAVIALATVPADFEVEARGELQPHDRRDVFAPSDGVVSDLRVADAARVRAEDLLLVLRKPELDLEFQRVWGELQTAQQRLAAIEPQRLQNPRETEQQRRLDHRLTAEEEELKEWIRSLRRQYEIVRSQQSVLEVRSPIDGQVLTWNVGQLLEARPVRQGQILITVAHLQGAWVLELQVPDDRIADVLAAQEQFGRRLDVSFVLATDPGVVHRGQIEEIGSRVEVTESDESVVMATVSIDRDAMAELIPGTTVVGKIHCGRRPVGYVWLHDLLETVRSWIVF